MSKFTLKDNEIQVKCKLVYPELQKPKSVFGKAPLYMATVIISDRNEAQRYKQKVALIAKQEGVSLKKVPAFSGDDKVKDWDESYPEKAGQKDFFKKSLWCVAKSTFQPQVISFPDGYTRVQPSTIISGSDCIVTIRLYKAEDDGKSTGNKYKTLCAGLGNIALVKVSDIPVGYNPESIRDAEDEFASFKSEYGSQISKAEENNNVEGQGFVTDDDSLPFYDSNEAV
jgi:hypothetical protein